MTKIKSLWKKFWQSDYKLLVVAGIALVILLVITFGKSDKATSDDGFYNYCQSLESKTESVLGKIEGAGKVSVAITYDSGGETVYAYETQSKTQGGVTSEESKIVTIGGNPLVIKEKLPNIVGVVIVADGGSDAFVRVQLKQAVVTLLGVDVGNVQVFSSKNGGTKND